MLDQTASKTALATATMRAAHQILDEPPLLLDDPLAVALLGPGAAERIRADPARHEGAERLALRAHVCLRSRFAEDQLAQAVAAGVGTYVLVGAGFDTFALRLPAWARHLRVVEVDHPATQAAKRDLMARAGLAEPGNLTFLACDFTEETLAQALARQGLEPAWAVYFSWLGVSMYLDEAAIEASLKAMAAFAPGSAVTMTFRQPPTEDKAPSRLAQVVEGVGERFLTFFTPEAMEAKLRQCGFSRTLFLTPDLIRARYYTPSRRDLPLPRLTNTVCAWV